MSSYSVFITSAYLTVVMILGALTMASLRARNKTRHALAERGLERRR